MLTRGEAQSARRRLHKDIVVKIKKDDNNVRNVLRRIELFDFEQNRSASGGNFSG